MPILSSTLLIAAHFVQSDDPLNFLYTCLIPNAAKLSVSVVTLLLLRAIANNALTQARLRQQFGRKSLLVAGSSWLFTASCLYRSLNIADEGAFLCRGPVTAFNAPAAGRAVATIGELALVIQLQVFLKDAALRLDVRSAVSASRWRTLAPALVAETCSWLGVLSGVSRFFCAEYLSWVAIAGMWAWDAAECLHKSRHRGRRGDGTVHAAILLASLALAMFNLCHELPHFFVAAPLNGDASAQHGGAVAAATAARATPFSCTQDVASPIWLARLPFFVTYFIGASAASATLAARHVLRGNLQGSERLGHGS